MRERAEYDRRLLERDVVGPLKGQRSPTETYGLPALLVRRGEGERETRVIRDERAEFAPGVTARAEDADRDGIHVLMHNHAGLDGQWSFVGGRAMIECANRGGDR